MRNTLPGSNTVSERHRRALSDAIAAQDEKRIEAALRAHIEDVEKHVDVAYSNLRRVGMMLNTKSAECGSHFDVSLNRINDAHYSIRRSIALLRKTMTTLGSV